MMGSKLKNHLIKDLLSKFNPELKRLEKRLGKEEHKVQFIKFPIFLDGVMDWVRYNVKLKKFDQLGVQVAKKGIMETDWLPPGSIYCDETETEVIDLVRKEITHGNRR